VTVLDEFRTAWSCDGLLAGGLLTFMPDLTLARSRLVSL
jgi:hypothetical protein